MGRRPDVVIVVRHGARLDQHQPTWHLTSPAPYDPPLTYGGWIQSRALGLRIASLLREREKDAASSGAATPVPEDLGLEVHDAGPPRPRRPPKKHRVVVHSSPFLRCVQTSIGIGAGLSQYEGLVAGGRKGSETRIKTVNQLRGSPKLLASDASSSPKLHPVPELHHESREAFRQMVKEQKQPPRATLRIDAFLGEWLSPDYFDAITPPPASALMAAAAKAELLRPADAIDSFTPSSPKLSGNLWGGGGGDGAQPARHHAHSLSVATPSALAQDADGPLEDWKAFSRTLPQRCNSVGRHKSPAARSSHGHSTAPKHESSVGYTPPAPTYAISPGDAIPRGYVAHARDQCLDIDRGWDSTREPQRWGDGGQYGEEWSQMHKRFRHGINSMIDWYASHPPGIARPHDEHEAVPEAALDRKKDDDDGGGGGGDDDEDLVVILVTHGAGCNALIGALTNQPVLLDVSMASLTMAVQKGPSPNGSKHESPVDSPALGPVDGTGRPEPRRQSSFGPGLSSLYEMKLTASADHLRPGVDPSKTSAPAGSSPPLSGSQTVPHARTRRVGSRASVGASVDSDRTKPESRASVNSSLGSARRPSRPAVNTVAQTPGPVAVPAPATDSPTGLWNPASAKGDGSLGFVGSLARSASVSSRLAISETQAPERSVSPKNSDTSSGAERNDSYSAVVEEAKSEASELPPVAADPPSSLKRSLSKRGLWGSAPSDSVSPREVGISKRRWTVAQD